MAKCKPSPNQRKLLEVPTMKRHNVTKMPTPDALKKQNPKPIPQPARTVDKGGA